jgi:copper chaperone NosL
MKKILLFTFLFFSSTTFFTSCSSELQPITYGKDLCEFCRMTISDTKFGSEIMTMKGRTFKFDCIECMIRFMKANHFDANNLSRMLVSNYLNGGNFLEAQNAVYLKSQSLPSPMGEGISAYSNVEDLKHVYEQYGGNKYLWKDLFPVVN